MSLITISDLTFAYDGNYDNVFENVNFQIDTHWKLGFIGRNGRGKTTFLNLLMGNYEYSGTISGGINFEYFPYTVPNQQENAIDIVADIFPDYLHWQLLRELSLLELPEHVLYRPFNTLSKGEQTKILLAILFLKENSFLLIDEPTNHLDIHGRKLVSNYLKSKEGFILVSHDRAFLDGCVDHILSITNTGIEVQRGNFSTWHTNKERQEAFEVSENEKRKREIKHLSDASQRTAVWSSRVEKSKYGTKNSGSKVDRGYIGHKSAKMMKRSKTIEERRQKAIEEKSKLLLNTDDIEKLKIAEMPYHTNRLISLENVSIFYGDRKVCGDISFTIDRGDRVALCGGNGSGKSSIINLICGRDIQFTGDFHRGSRLVISYVPQDTSFLEGNLSEYAQDEDIDESLFKAILRKLDFSRVQFEKDMRSFSQGQKKKVLIAKSLCQKSHLYVWDEPLNFIDVISRIQIEQLLLEYQPTILFVEHDSVFRDNIATKWVNQPH